jgi:hypothetical protein
MTQKHNTGNYRAVEINPGIKGGTRVICTGTLQEVK